MEFSSIIAVDIAKDIIAYLCVSVMRLHLWQCMKTDRIRFILFNLLF